VSPEDLEVLTTEHLLCAPLEQALADDEEIRMRGPEARIVDFGASLMSFVVSDFRQLPSRVDQRIGESCLLENPQGAWMDREGVAVLSRPLVRVDDLHTNPILLEEQGSDETDGAGADDENLRIRMTDHRAFSSRASARAMGWTCSPQTRRR
jgi:hypothetical protein